MMRLRTTNSTSLIQTTVEDLVLQDSVPQATPRKKRSRRLTQKPINKSDNCRRVHFEKPDKVFRRSPQHQNIPHSDLWYTEEDIQHFRYCFREDARTVARSSTPKYEQAVLRTFLKCYQSPTTKESVDRVLLTDLREFLEDRTKIGLERMTSREIFRDKQNRRRMLWNAVADIQLEQEPSTNRAKALRQACEEISRPSRMFAYYLGRAASSTKKVKKETKKNRERRQ
jgi:hypothetical protein